MLTLIDPFTVGNITVYRDEKDRDLLYTAPGSLKLVMLPKGTPSFTLMYFGDAATLMLETEWRVGEEERIRILEQASAVYRAKQAMSQTSRWRLAAVPVMEGKARLFLEEAGAQPALLSETSVSGYGSMRTAFSLQLKVATAARIERALRVDDADLTAIYQLTCAAASHAAISWEANLALVKRVLTGAGLREESDDILAALLQLRESGAIKETLNPAASTPGQGDQIRHALATMLAGYLVRGAATGVITLTQAATEPQRLILMPSCSLSEALRGFKPAVYVRNLGSN